MSCVASDGRTVGMLEEEHTLESRGCVYRRPIGHTRKHGSGDDRELVIFHLVHTSRGAFI